MLYWQALANLGDPDGLKSENPLETVTETATEDLLPRRGLYNGYFKILAQRYHDSFSTVVYYVI